MSYRLSLFVSMPHFVARVQNLTRANKCGVDITSNLVGHPGPPRHGSRFERKSFRPCTTPAVLAFFDLRPPVVSWCGRPGSRVFSGSKIYQEAPGSRSLRQSRGWGLWVRDPPNKAGDVGCTSPPQGVWGGALGVGGATLVTTVAVHAVRGPGPNDPNFPTMFTTIPSRARDKWCR